MVSSKMGFLPYSPYKPRTVIFIPVGSAFPPGKRTVRRFWHAPFCAFAYPSSLQASPTRTARGNRPKEAPRRRSLELQPCTVVDAADAPPVAARGLLELSLRGGRKRRARRRRWRRV